METKTGNLLIVKFMGGKIKKGWETALDPMYEFETSPKSISKLFLKKAERVADGLM